MTMLHRLIWKPYLLAILLFSCEKVDDPKAFMGVIDEISPSLRISSPAENQLFKNFLTVEFYASDYFGINNIGIQLDGFNAFGGTLTHVDSLYTFVLDIAYLSGNHRIDINVYDAQGNLSQTGLNFRAQPVIKHATTGYDVYAISPDPSGYMWFATSNGIVRFIGSGFIMNPSGFNLPSPQVRSIAINSKNEVWLDYYEKYTSNYSKLVVYNGVSITKSFYYPDVFFAGYQTYFSDFHFDKGDTLWGIWSESGTYGYFSFKDSIWNINYIPGANPTAMAIDTARNSKWFVSSAGVHKFDGSSWQVFNSDNSALPSGYCNRIKIDQQNNVWVSIYRYSQPDCIAKFDGMNWTICSNLPNADIKDFCIDNKGMIWIGIQDGYVWKYNGQSILRAYQTESPGAMYHRSGSIFIGTAYGIYWISETGL